MAAKDGPAVVKEAAEPMNEIPDLVQEATEAATECPAVTEERAKPAKETPAAVHLALAVEKEVKDCIHRSKATALARHRRRAHAKKTAVLAKENAAVVEESKEPVEKSLAEVESKIEATQERLAVVEATVNESPVAVEESSDPVIESPDFVEEAEVATKETLAVQIAKETTEPTKESPAVTEDTAEPAEESPALVEETKEAAQEIPGVVDEETESAKENPALVEEPSEPVIVSSELVEEAEAFPKEIPAAAVEKTTETANENPAALKEAAEPLNEILAIVQEIPMAAKDGPAAVEETAEPMNEIPDLVQETTEAVTECSAVIEERTKPVKETPAAVQVAEEKEVTPAVVEEKAESVKESPAVVEEATEPTKNSMQVEDTKQALENGTCSEEDSAETVPEIPSHIIVTTVTGSDSDSECSSSIDDMLDTSEAHFYPMQDQAEVVEPKTVKISALTLLSGVFDPPSITTTGTTERSLPSSASRKKSALSLLQQGSGDSTKPTNSVKTQETSESTPRIFVLCKDTVYFDNVPMYHSQMVIVASNLIGLCLSMATSSQLLLNVVALGVAFGCSTLPTLLPRGVLLRARLSAAAVALWAIKLSILLVYRASILQHDARLDGHLSTFAGRLQFWAFAVVFGLVCSLPHCLGTTSSDPGSNMHLRLGIIVYLAGMAIETVADYQKWNFKQEHSGTEFCQTGLWSMSQHPNYFGEILVWSGIFIVNAPSLVERYPGDSTARRLSCFWRVALAILGPLFVCASLAAQANGSLSNAGELAHVKYGYGTNVVYTKYVDNVPLIVPSPFELFPKMHLEVRPKGKDLKKNRRIFPERVQPAATNDAPVPTFAKVLYPSISPATDSTKDFKSNENPTKLNRDTRTKTPIKEYKAKQIRRNEAAEKRTKVKPSPPKAPKVEAAPVRAGWKFPRLFSRSETKDEHKKMVKRKETKDEHKKMVKRKDMWRLDPDTIFL